MGLYKWFINKWYNNSPQCMCGYNMKPIITKSTSQDHRWKCLFTKTCGWQVYETWNGKLHWTRK